MNLNPFFLLLSFYFHRVFAIRRCTRCMTSISSSELVMRARHLVFHVTCFTCVVCNSALTKGDQFGMRDSQIFCRLVLTYVTINATIPQNMFRYSYATFITININSQMFSYLFFNQVALWYADGTVCEHANHFDAMSVFPIRHVTKWSN